MVRPAFVAEGVPAHFDLSVNRGIGEANTTFDLPVGPALSLGKGGG